MSISVGELREMLIDELQKLRGGKTSIDQARAVAQLSDSIIKSVIAEIMFQKHIVWLDNKGFTDSELGTLLLARPTELSKEDIKLIKSLYKDGMSIKEIAVKFEISEGRVKRFWDE